MEREMRRPDQRKSRRAKKYRRRRIVQSLACLVVFCTTYALILPAITLEKPSYCGFKEHKHSDKCYTQELVCEKEEGKGHTHSDACYTEHQNLICGLEESEGHSHTDECYQTYDNLICDLEENEEHTHGPECYEQVTELVCQLEETEGHTHTDACYETVRELSCGQEEAEGHKHTKDCYKKVLTCKKEEHEHTLECYSNPKADIETQADWEKTLPKEEELTGVWADDLLKVAETQLNYVESSHNYKVADDDVTMGYTRYGAWYGMPYEDWCAMFIEFCLHYAGIPKTDMPRAASCTKWVRLLTEKEMYMKAEDGRPEPGDLVFFDVDKEKGPDHVGIVIEVDEKDGIKTIEGNSGNKVAHREYKWDDKTLYGYGLLPENPNPEVKAQLEEHEPEELDPEEMAELHPEAAESEAPAEEQKTVEFTGETDTVTVRVEAPEGAFPEGTTMEVSTVAAEDVMDAVTGAVDGEVAHVDAVDIKFIYNGEEIEPELPIQVFMTPIDELPAGAPKVIHVQDDGSATEVDNVTTPEGEEGLQFEADSFSVYALVYTVDYEYSVNGEVYQFSLPGGGYVSFADLVEALGIIGNTTITLDDFMAGVASVEFSSPELVDVSMVDADTTVGQIKESRGLECQYSAELTEKQIAEINSTEVQSGDWALISVQPFTSEESLTVTMKDGEVFTVRVTDYQISTNVLTADGKNYKITVTFDDAAEIPGGTELMVEELAPESDEYLQRLGQAWYEVNREYFEVKEKRENYTDDMGDLPDLPLVNLDHARFFDISLVKDGEEIEPKTPVQVEIAYDNGMTMVGEAVPGVVHYTKDAVEFIDDVEIVTEGSDVRAFKYEQASFSDTGTYIGQKTYDEVAGPVNLPAPTPMEYPLLQTKKNALNALRKVFKSKNGSEQLSKPTATKTLTPNKANGKNDGTYTLELAVDGHATTSTETMIKKSNVLIVMDRSSSMINNIDGSDVTQVAHYDNNRHRYYSGAYGNDSWSPTEGVTYYGYINSNGNNRYRELFYNNGQFYYYDSQDVTTATTRSYTGNIYTSTRRTRLDEEQEALEILIHDLLAKNGTGTTDDGVSLEDIVEISVISFAKDRMDKNDGAPHLSSEQDWSTNYNDLITAVNDQYAPSGTNWEQALRYAVEKINAKKADPSQAGEDYYLLFLTDGEPTSTMDHHSGAYYYSGSSHGGFDNAYNPARNYLRDQSGIAAAEDIHFYGIMTWGTNETMRSYLKRLVNVGNGNVTNESDFSTEAVANNYFDADSLSKLEEAFSNIFNLVSNSVAYEQVSITDGLTTDAMTTTLVNGSAKGFQYTVYKDRVVDEDGKIVSPGTPVYTVTATDGEGEEPNVTFHINGEDYTGDAVQKKPYEYDELQADGTTTVHKTKYYYSVTVGEGENAHEYKMTLANKTNGKVEWDLAAVGALEDGYTYAVSFTVWPDQDAYDYVAALNNGLDEITDSNNETVQVKWNPSVETDANKVTDSNGKSYWKGGALPDYPSIVKYTDGTYAVLTNTDQSLKYTIAKTEQTGNNDPIVTYDGPYTSNLPTPNPMPLTGTASQLEKVWNINRDPSILYKYLYESKDKDGKPVAFDIGFKIDQDGEEYKDVHLPGAATVTEEGVSYDWSAYEAKDLVTYNGKEFSKRWSQDFSISTGLMLSEAQMDARQLDKSLYDDKKYQYNGTWYYVLEPGHDFKIKEPDVGYEFDFEGPTYHPMLVDGVLTDVQFTTEGGTKSITGMEALEIDTPTGKSALTVFNTLRGYINVKKKVVDYDGTDLTTDNTEFTFEVELTNAMPVFEGDHIPWYGVNRLYYHNVDAADEYYQAEYKNGQLQVTTEEGGPYVGESVGITFNPDNAGEQTIKYSVDGQEKTVTICGNIMTPSEGSPEEGYKKVTGIAKITQAETLYIANVPVNTHYTIKETGLAALGYQLTNIDRQVGTNASAGVPVNENAAINGEIVQNTETLITYTNKCLVTDITIQKTDNNGNGLKGAVFRLVKLVDGGAGVQSESDASSIESVSGLSTITKKVHGETQSYSSAFESNGNVQTIQGLPDGTYRLYEVCIPPGYISTYSYIQFEIEDRVMKNVITDTGDTSNLDTTANNINLKIKNIPGRPLPHTGGMGTHIFYGLGMILVICAGILLVSRRRAGNK